MSQLLFRRTLLRFCSTGSGGGAGEKKAFMELVKTLRYRTEAPLMDCSNALKESHGNMDEAIRVLQKKGQARALKKEGRATAHGFVVGCLVDPLQFATPSSSSSSSSSSSLASTSVTGRVAAAAGVISVCSETDFAARNSHFQMLCVTAQKHLAELITSTGGEVLRSQAGATAALQEAAKTDIQAAAGVLGENVVIKSVLPLLVTVGEGEGEREQPRRLFMGSYTHGTVTEAAVGRLVGIVVLEHVHGTAAPAEGEGGALSEQDLASAVARHFVATSGEAEEESGKQQHQDAEGGGSTPLTTPYIRHTKYAHQPFFGASAGPNGRVETVGQWLKHRGVKLVKAIVQEYGKDPIVSEPPAPGQQQRHAGNKKNRPQQGGNQ